ncbi:MAG: phenylalanine--tRNA ligase subunit beta, partial [Candidatus Chisholmbacteria bacterium]|nr:phenylalanine--tRNA ligase subunit beta [Candidatus Chisholmbacteria bacterium]
MKAPKSWLTQFINLNGVSNLDFAERMTFAGNKVDSLQKINHDTIFDFEVTSNRPDTLSIIGLAREASAIFTRPLKLPKAPKLSSLKNNPISFNVSDQKLCPTYSLVEVAKVKVKPASKLIQSRLKLSGVETVNNIVDVTNYLMLETGQPMHAFNADKIHGPLTLRAAKQGEKIIPLDHKQRTLLGGEIIIEDKEKLVDLAGLMGGLNTEISSQTTRVLLLVPIYDPVSIRRASKNLGLRTEASLRFEKKLDLTQTPEVALRAVKLLEKEARGRQTTAILTHKATFKSPSIRLDARDASFRLGVTLSQNQIDDCLKPLAIKKTTSGYQPPPWRRDLAEPVDLIEEVARIFGYNKFPKTMPSGVIPTHPDALAPNWLRLIRNAVAALGFTETYRDTLIGQDTITSLGLKPQTHLKVLHPMSKDYEYMRSTLMENLIPSLVFNLGHSQNIKLFELGTVFYPTQSSTILPDQPTELGL